jgi:hypothetical protein
VVTKIIDADTFDKFLSELHQRDSIRLVKLADYGFVAPLRKGPDSFVLAPQIKIVATALDKQGDNAGMELIRWQSMRRANQTATVVVGKAPGNQAEVGVFAKKEDLRKWLELEGYSVSDGEWTQADVDRLAKIRKGRTPLG